jgi:hypothetical protein
MQAPRGTPSGSILQVRRLCQKMIGMARRKHFHCSQFRFTSGPGRACMRSRERETGLTYLTGVMCMHEALHELST